MHDKNVLLDSKLADLLFYFVLKKNEVFRMSFWSIRDEMKQNLAMRSPLDCKMYLKQKFVTSFGLMARLPCCDI